MISLRKQKILSNPCYYACSRIREFESLPLKTLFSDCQELYKELQTIYSFNDNAKVSDAISVLLDYFLDQEKNGVSNLCRLILILFAPIVKSYVGDSSISFPQLIFDYTDSFFNETALGFCNKYDTKNIILDTGNNVDATEDDKFLPADIYSSQFIATSSFTPQYKKAFSDCTFMKSYGGLICKIYSNILVDFDGRTNLNWLPECLPLFDDDYAFESEVAQDSISNLLKVTLFPMIMALDDGFYNQLLEV